MNTFNLKFKSKQELYEKLSQDILEKLDVGNTKSIGLSGGTSLNLLYDTFVKKQIDLSRYNLCLIDDRCVPVESKNSNKGNLYKNLISRIKNKPKIYDIYDDELSMHDNITKASLLITKECLPLDMLILGMGDDGHIASIFSDIKEPLLESIMNIKNKKNFSIISSKKSRTSRITMNINTLVKSKKIYLVIPEREKYKILKKSMLIKNEKLFPVYSLIKYLDSNSQLFIYAII